MLYTLNVVDRHMLALKQLSDKEISEILEQIRTLQTFVQEGRQKPPVALDRHIETKSDQPSGESMNY